MTCQDFRDSVQSALDAATRVALPDELRAHAETCPQCIAFFESSLALHQAMHNLPQVSPSTEFVASLKRINQLDYVPVRLSWVPEIRLGAALLTPLALPYVAQAFSSDQLQHILEALILLLGLTFLGLTALKPYILGAPDYRPASEKH